MRKGKKIPVVDQGSLTSFDEIMTDPFGSYTGCPADPLEKPVQDADDL